MKFSIALSVLFSLAALSKSSFVIGALSAQQTIVMTRSGTAISNHWTDSSWPDNKLVFTTPTSADSKAPTTQQQLRSSASTTSSTTLSTKYSEATTQKETTFVGYDAIQSLALVEPEQASTAPGEDYPTILFTFGASSSNNTTAQLCSIDLSSKGDNETTFSTTATIVDCFIMPVGVYTVSSIDARDGTIVMYKDMDGSYKINYDQSTGTFTDNSLQKLTFNPVDNIPTDDDLFSISSILVLNDTYLMTGWSTMNESKSSVMKLDQTTGVMTQQRQFEYSSAQYALYIDTSNGNYPYVYRGSTVDVIDPFKDPSPGNTTSDNNPSDFKLPDVYMCSSVSPYVAVNQDKGQVMFAPCYIDLATSFDYSMQVYSIRDDPMNPQILGLLPLNASDQSLTGIATADGKDLASYTVIYPSDGVTIASTTDLLDIPSGATSTVSFGVVATVSIIGMIITLI